MDSYKKKIFFSSSLQQSLTPRLFSIHIQILSEEKKSYGYYLLSCATIADE